MKLLIEDKEKEKIVIELSYDEITQFHEVFTFQVSSHSFKESTREEFIRLVEEKELSYDKRIKNLELKLHQGVPHYKVIRTISNRAYHVGQIFFYNIRTTPLQVDYDYKSYDDDGMFTKYFYDLEEAEIECKKRNEKFLKENPNITF